MGLVGQARSALAGVILVRRIGIAKNLKKRFLSRDMDI
jgi:hypothetical protein